MYFRIGKVQQMADGNAGCLFVLLSLPSAIMGAFRQEAWHRSFPRPQKLQTVKEAMDIVAELMSDHGGSGAAFPYARWALELEPQNVCAAKFMANYYVPQKKFTEALPYLRAAAQDAHPDSIYIVMLKQALAALGKHTQARDAREGQ